MAAVAGRLAGTNRTAASVGDSDGLVVSFGSRRARGHSMDAALSTLIASAEQGNRPAADLLFSTLYDELHRMARRELAKRGAGMTLGATTLLHEAYLDISGRERAAFPDRNRFMAYASRVMRGLIIDYARQPPGAEARRRVRDHVDRHRRRRAVPDPRRADAHQRRARRARSHRRPARADRRPQVLLRLLLRRDCGDAWPCRSARCSATGRKRGSTCTRPCGTTPRCLMSAFAARFRSSDRMDML